MTKTNGKIKLPVLVFFTLLFIVIDSQTILYGLKLNLTILIVYYVSFHSTPFRSLICASLIGMLMDSISFILIGPNILSKTVISILTISAKSGIFNWTSIFFPIFGFLMTVTDGFIIFFSVVIFGNHPFEVTYTLKTSIFQAIINSAVVFGFVKYKYGEEIL